MTLSPEKIVVSKRRSISESRISLIIPIFNQATKISYSLEKIKQAVEFAFSNYELIVVNILNEVIDNNKVDEWTLLTRKIMINLHWLLIRS